MKLSVLGLGQMGAAVAAAPLDTAVAVPADGRADDSLANLFESLRGLPVGAAVL